jgi:hypothetical protein
MALARKTPRSTLPSTGNSTPPTTSRAASKHPRKGTRSGPTWVPTGSARTARDLQEDGCRPRGVPQPGSSRCGGATPSSAACGACSWFVSVHEATFEHKAAAAWPDQNARTRSTLMGLLTGPATQRRGRCCRKPGAPRPRRVLTYIQRTQCETFLSGIVEDEQL